MMDGHTHGHDLVSAHEESSVIEMAVRSLLFHGGTVSRRTHQLTILHACSVCRRRRRRHRRFSLRLPSLTLVVGWFVFYLCCVRLHLV